MESWQNHELMFSAMSYLCFQSRLASPCSSPMACLGCAVLACSVVRRSILWRLRLKPGDVCGVISAQVWPVRQTRRDRIYLVCDSGC